MVLYLRITAHFFTGRDHKRCISTIAVRKLPSPHTAERVEEIVYKVLTGMHIPRTKISAMLTDNERFETESTSPTQSPSEEDTHQDDISDDNRDLEEETIAEVDSGVVNFEQNDWVMM